MGFSDLLMNFNGASGTIGDYSDDGSCAVSPNNPFANWNPRYGSYPPSSVDNTRIETSIYWLIQVFGKGIRVFGLNKSSWMTYSNMMLIKLSMICF
jgi:hypothetical protein